MPRAIHSHYTDPLDELWLATARRVGLRVARERDVYASTDGAGTLLLSDRAGMDADDCLAQMIFHELCHALVMGPQSFEWVDWGLDNETSRDDVLEHACLRLQAALLEPLGLRQVLAPTTDFRAYYDALPADPFSERHPDEREAITRGRAAYARRTARPFGRHLQDALEATASLVAIASPYATSDSVFARFEQQATKKTWGVPLHPLARRGEAPRCGDCAWAYRGKTKVRCRQGDGRIIGTDDVACERFEAPFDCLGCGACCREAYDTVEVREQDRAAKRHLHLLREHAGGHDMARKDFACIALQGGVTLRRLTPAITRTGAATSDSSEPPAPPLGMPGGAPYTCEIYEDRPRTCRDFTLGHDNCLYARRRVGLSR